MDQESIVTTPPNRLSLLDRKALVTGSSTGIGRGVALAFARNGAGVVLNYHGNPGRAEEVLAEVQALGRRSTIIKADVSDVAQVRELVAKSVEALGGLDVLGNNAGIEKRAPFWEVAEADYDAVLGVNLKGVFFGSQAFVQHCMATRQRGKIVNMSSIHEELASFIRNSNRACGT